MRNVLVVATGLTLYLTACGEPQTEIGTDNQVTMARVDDSTQWFQAEVNRQILIELGYEVSDPSQETVDPNTFYPALASGQYDLWADGWFPNHEPYRTGTYVTGGTYAADVTPIERNSDLQIVQGYMADRATVEELGIASIDDLADPAVAGAFDSDGDGTANLVGCNEGWGCNLTTEEQMEEYEWGANVEHVTGDFFDLFEGVITAAEAGEPVLFYNWTPNWTIEVLVPGEDVVWLEATALPDTENTSIPGLEACASGADPCELGWAANDVMSVVNTDFIEDHPDIRTLLEQVDVPGADVSAQNIEMYNAGNDYSQSDLEQAALDWIEANRDAVDGWLEAARAEQ